MMKELVFALTLGISANLSADDEIREMISDAHDRFADSTTSLVIVCHGCDLNNENDDLSKKYVKKVMLDIRDSGLPKSGQFALLQTKPVVNEQSDNPEKQLEEMRRFKPIVATYKYTKTGAKLWKATTQDKSPYKSQIHRAVCYSCENGLATPREYLAQEEIQLALGELYLDGLTSTQSPFQGLLWVSTDEKRKELERFHYMVYPGFVSLMTEDGFGMTYIP